MRFDRLPLHAQDLADRAFRLWNKDPQHPSLHFKRVGTAQPVYSVRVGAHWRALALISGRDVQWFWIGSHAEYDRLIVKF
jgi:hypothetical protein